MMYTYLALVVFHAATNHHQQQYRSSTLTVSLIKNPPYAEFMLFVPLTRNDRSLLAIIIMSPSSGGSTHIHPEEQPIGFCQNLCPDRTERPPPPRIC